MKLYFHVFVVDFVALSMDFDAVISMDFRIAMFVHFHEFLCCISMDFAVVFPWLHFLRFPWCPDQVPHISTHWEATLGNPEINYSNGR